MSDEAINHLSVLMEQVISQNQAVLEAVSGMRKSVALIPAMRDDIDEMKADMKIVKAAVAATNRDVTALEHRVTRLESA